MNNSRRLACNGRAGGRSGNMMVTAMLLVMGMMVMTAGIHTMLNGQINEAGQMQQIGLAKLQGSYLAEMGLNYVMFMANENPDVANPFPVTQTAGQATTFDFKNNVKLAQYAGGVAKCTVVYQSGNATQANFQVTAHLVTLGGTYDHVIQFATTKLVGTGQPWVLAGYTVIR